MHRTILRILLVLLVALIDRSCAGEGSHTHRDWLASHQKLIRDAADGYLDDFSLLHASLLVSPDTAGHPAAYWRNQFQRHVQQCSARLPQSGDDLMRAEAVFRYMHDQILTHEYREDITSVRYCLQDGSYNCVSSTLIYICLCRAVGVPAQAVALPDHVFVKLKLPTTVLIETTDPRWTLLDPHDRRIDQIHFLREISDVALLGRFFYNQGITRAKQSEFSQAVRAARLSCQLDPDDHAAHINLLATLNNWSLSLCRTGRYEQASQLVAQGLSLNSTYPPLIANDVYVHQMWIAALRRKGNRHQADAIERALQERLRSRQHRAQTRLLEGFGRI